MSFTRYSEKISEILKTIDKNEREIINKIAEKFVETINNDGIIHVFGSGHSHMLAEEVFYRAGGLAVMSPIFDSGTMLDEGAIKSTKMERLEGYGEIILDNYELQEKDLMLVVSNSGRNPVPIDAALKAQKEGLEVIAITSLEYSKANDSRHHSGKRLFEVADYVLDNHTPYGDAVIDFEITKAVPGSTIAASYIINGIIAEVIAIMKEKDLEIPVYKSGNIDGADADNKKLAQKYGKRIKDL